MQSERLSYAGIAGAVAGVIGVLGIYAKWFTVAAAGGTVSLKGTTDASGKLALAMSIATFAFGAAYVLISDGQIRRAMGALVAVCAVALTLACVWAVARADGAEIARGLWVSGLGGMLGIGAGILTLRDDDGAPAEDPSADDAPAEVVSSSR